MSTPCHDNLDVQNDQSASSGARAQRPKRAKAQKVLSTEAPPKAREFKRYVIAAAALRGIYTLDELADQVGVTPASMRNWWAGALPKAETLDRIAKATGLPRSELVEWVHYDGPPPTFPTPETAAVAEDPRDTRIQRAHAAPRRRRHDDPP